MISSGMAGMTKAFACKSFRRLMLFSAEASEDCVSDHLELEFADVFGPLPPAQEPEELDPVAEETSRDVIYSDPDVIQNRSHSLVGPSCVVHCRKLSKLALGEMDGPVEEESAACDRTANQPVSADPANVACVVGIDDFEVLRVVGQGAFGKVYQVRRKGTSEIYAMKVMRKDRIVEKNHVEYMISERDILAKIDHPFIVQLKYSFQTKYRLYLVLDFVNGGHLFFQLYHQGFFREELARVYAAEIVSVVSHLHANNIMHRDLKPENILLDANGHVMVTDFGLAKQFDVNTRSNSMCGTVEYMAPEIIVGKGHDKAADWWSVGALLFEMLTGKAPFTGGNRVKIQQKIVKEKLKMPSFLTREAHSLLKGLLQKEASKRLGSGREGSEQVKRHKWFRMIDWKKLDAREIQPSFRPTVAGSHCTANFEKRWTDMPLADSPAASPKINSSSSNPFSNFTYVRPPPCFLRHQTNPFCAAASS